MARSHMPDVDRTKRRFSTICNLYVTLTRATSPNFQVLTAEINLKVGIFPSRCKGGLAGPNLKE